MQIERPDLSETKPEIIAYIQYLEAQLEKVSERSSSVEAQSMADLPPLEVSEPPTTDNVITATAGWKLKRTPRHEYTRQRRGGMGVFDIETPEDQPPTILSLADESATLLLATSTGRAFQLPVKQIPQSEIRSRGTVVTEKISFNPGEYLAAVTPIQAEGYLAVLSQTGMLRTLRHHVFGEYMKPGMNLFDPKTFGTLAHIAWTPGDADLFIATRSGKATRFSEKLVPPQGCLGMRVSSDDVAVSVTPVYDDSGVFLLSADGKGTIRLMEGFAANKAPGAGGKNAINTDRLVAALSTEHAEDVFIISRLGKIIRFSLVEVPPKTGVVQGVNCMSFRADEAACAAIQYSNSIF